MRYAVVTVSMLALAGVEAVVAEGFGNLMSPAPLEKAAAAVPTQGGAGNLLSPVLLGNGAAASAGFAGQATPNKLDTSAAVRAEGMEQAPARVKLDAEKAAAEKAEADKTNEQKVAEEKKKAKECQAATAKAERTHNPDAESEVAKKCSAADYTQTAQAPAAETPVPVEDTSKLNPNSQPAALGRLLDPNMTKVGNLTDGRNINDVKVLKVHNVNPAVGESFAKGQLLNGRSLNDPASNVQMAGGISGVGGAARVVDTVDVKVAERAFGPNTFVSVESNNIKGLQDLSKATTGENYNGLTTDQQGNKGWYAYNNKTKKMEFVPISALEKGVPIGQSPSNFGGAFGDHRAAAGNLKDHSHQGNDWMQQKGSAIYSTVSGQITDMGQGTGNVGNRIWIKTDDGQMKVMTAHMDSLNTELKVGDRVAAGEYIGTVGNSGATWSDPHLHIETRLTNGGSGLGTAYDPKKILAGVYNDTSGLAQTVGVVGGSGFTTPGVGAYNVATAGAGSGGGSIGSGGNIINTALQTALNGGGLNVNGLLGGLMGGNMGYGGNGNGNVFSAVVAGLVSQMMSGGGEKEQESDAYHDAEVQAASQYGTTSESSSAYPRTAGTDGKLTGYDIVMAMKEMCANQLNTAVDAASLKLEACSKVMAQ